MSAELEPSVTDHPVRWCAFVYVFGWRDRATEHPSGFVKVLDDFSAVLGKLTGVQVHAHLDEAYLEAKDLAGLVDSVISIQVGVLRSRLLVRGIIFTEPRPECQELKGVPRTSKTLEARSVCGKIKNVGFAILSTDVDSMSSVNLVNYFASPEPGVYSRFNDLRIDADIKVKTGRSGPKLLTPESMKAFVASWLTARSDSEKLVRFFLPFALNWLQCEGDRLFEEVRKGLDWDSEFPTTDYPFLGKLSVARKIQLVPRFDGLELFVMRLVDLMFDPRVEGVLREYVGKTPDGSYVFVIIAIREKLQRSPLASSFSIKERSASIPLDVLSLGSRRNFVDTVARER